MWGVLRRGLGPAVNPIPTRSVVAALTGDLTQGMGSMCEPNEAVPTEKRGSRPRLKAVHLTGEAVPARSAVHDLGRRPFTQPAKPSRPKAVHATGEAVPAEGRSRSPSEGRTTFSHRLASARIGSHRLASSAGRRPRSQRRDGCVQRCKARPHACTEGRRAAFCKLGGVLAAQSRVSRGLSFEIILYLLR